MKILITLDIPCLEISIIDKILKSLQDLEFGNILQQIEKIECVFQK